MFGKLFGKGGTNPPPPPKFPYPLETVHGSKAFATFERLLKEGKGAPVIVGDDEALTRIANVMEFNTEDGRSPVSVLQAAQGLAFPESLRAAHAEEMRKIREKYPDIEEDEEPEVGTWPRVLLPGPSGPAVPYGTLTRLAHPRVHIALIPTADRTEIPAYLLWGNWNACPAPEQHVAALRSWRERYGAELVSMSDDVVELRVTRRPKDRDEAMALAREHYLYCNDTVDQGTGDLATLAASLMASDWWQFWWD